MTELVNQREGRVELGVGKVLWLYLMLGSALLVVLEPPSLRVIACSMGLAFLTLCAGHSVGLHRGVIHRAYRTSRFVRGLLVYLFVHTGIGGPLSWVRLHYVRDYYQNTASCPRYFGYAHSALRDYFWNLHLRFVPRDATLYGVPAAEEADPWLRFLEKTWFWHVLALWAGLCVAFGPAVAACCVSARVSVSVVGHWLIGFWAHKRGYVRYELDGSAEIGRNLPVFGVLSFGEGFHNNHHANPGSARMGEVWYELDLGWWTIRLLERLGLVTDVTATGRSPDVRRQNAHAVPAEWRGHAA